MIFKSIIGLLAFTIIFYSLLDLILNSYRKFKDKKTIKKLLMFWILFILII